MKLYHDYGLLYVYAIFLFYDAFLNRSFRLNYKYEIKDEIKVVANRITHDEMLKMAGKKIADFCRGYTLYYGKKVANDSLLRAGIHYIKLNYSYIVFITLNLYLVIMDMQI